MSAAPPSFTLSVLEVAGVPVPLVRRGPPAGPGLLILQPLFEEMNRTRRLLALVGAALAAAGIVTWLPDLPGAGDSSISHFTLARVAPAAAALAQALEADHILAVRGGALLTLGVPARAYLLAPVDGASLWRDMLRARAAADAEAGQPRTVAQLEAASAAGETLELAGYRFPPALARELHAARAPARAPGSRNVTLSPSPHADAVLSGPPVWRQSEPEDSSALAHALAQDIAAWIAGRC